MYCQKCRTPLTLDGSLGSLNPTAFELLVSKCPLIPIQSQRAVSDLKLLAGIDSTGKTVSDQGATPSANRSSNPPERRENYERNANQSTAPYYRPAACLFVMLTESQFGPPAVDTSSPSRVHRKSSQPHDPNHENGSFSSQVEKATRLFEIVSARSDIDHPICIECTDMLVDGLQKRLNASTKERDAYIAFLRTLNASVPSSEDIDVAEQSLHESLKAEETAFAELQALEREKDSLDEEIAGLEEESRQLDSDEESFWRARNGFSLTLGEFQTERDALNMRYDHDSQQLERLQRTNVYNDAFCIGHDGYFGTINALRLGRLANPSVEWPEINAAWGQTCLLLSTIADRLNFQFQGYRLRPLGSTSRIDKIEYPVQPAGTTATDRSAPKITQLDLFSSGDLPLNLPWLHRRFDSGMVAFLECLRQLGQFVEATPAPMASPRRGQPGTTAPGVRLPYEIKRDRIGDASIKLGFNQNDETWTRACKYTLTCCKFLLAHTSNVASTGSHSAAVAAAAVAASNPAARPSSTSSPAPAKSRP
ncbi:hypothetical protein N7509_004129 [Penicillium cosmopolitanum]|uniref:Autophagy-related protein 6 n=1 Tax=Penicillium cosmopolitanum TaxID=1131564 RepID=A0A9W9W6R3_9EURO|nr:uncharacterized protein N7509_004129 [Penicillium cosmopolitanum]KAJ5404258.1 hypothetical protein N7509_004129 [Penicillium cosmopolitanum]